jgi:DNA polymerase
MFVGEQPGDAEDKAGHPFVGPSGALLDRALEQAGVDRALVYVTNVVKHFKWSRGEKSKRRIHAKPNADEIRACMPWLLSEIELVRPNALVCLGATAAKAVLGNSFSVLKQRARPIASELAPVVFATVHPSAVLRAPGNRRSAEERAFFRDIARIATQL